MTQSSWQKTSGPLKLRARLVKILVLTNLYPPHHAGTYDLRCQAITDALRLRGHSTLVATSNHGLNTEQRDEEVHRRLLLNGGYGHPLLTRFRELQEVEEHNNRGLKEVIADLQPDSISSFRFDRLYFCSRALKQTTEQAGFRVSHGEIIHPGIPAQHFVGEVKPPSTPVKKLLIVSPLDEPSGVMTAAQALLHLRQNNAQAT